MRMIKNLLAGCVLLFASNTSAAIILTVVPSINDASPGDSVTVDLVISGLGNGAADSLAAFDIDVFYDSAALSVTEFRLGSFLGDFDFFEAIDDSIGDVGGKVNLAVVSLLFDFELDALQSASFVLASIDFVVDSLAVGTSTEIGFGQTLLGDAFGIPLEPSDTNSATFTNSISVNTPAIDTIFALSLIGLLFRKRGQKVSRQLTSD